MYPTNCQTMNKTKTLRKMLDNYRQKLIMTPGVHDPYCARIAEKIGFDALYMSGAATSMSRLGYADFGLMTATEIQMNAKYITSITKLPLIADADTGYGNALNTMRTVQDYINTGVSGIHIEDQIWPKRCGHLKGKRVIQTEEMIGKIRAAKSIIKEENPDFILIARTDVRGVSGGTMDQVIKRLKAYREAGADIVFADGLVSKEELERIWKEIGAPTLFHPTAISPRLTLEECQEIGVGLLIYPFASIHVMAVAVWDYLIKLKNNNTRTQIEFEDRIKDHTLKDIRKLFEMGGLNELQEYEKQFIPEEEIKLRYHKSIGL